MVKKRRTRYNAAKDSALELFKDVGEWIGVPTFTQSCGVLPPRRAYTYLGRLANFGLLARVRDGNSGHLLYRITERGRRRLDWLARSSD